MKNKKPKKKAKKRAKSKKPHIVTDSILNVNPYEVIDSIGGAAQWRGGIMLTCSDNNSALEILLLGKAVRMLGFSFEFEGEYEDVGEDEEHIGYTIMYKSDMPWSFYLKLGEYAKQSNLLRLDRKAYEGMIKDYVQS